MSPVSYALMSIYQAHYGVVQLLLATFINESENLSSAIHCYFLYQVAEYLKNLGTEYRFSCYYEKEAKGCHLLADYMEAIDHDSKTAFQVYLKNCDERNWAHSCHKVAGYRDGV